MGERGVHILYDNGEQHIVPEIAIMALTVEEGEQIHIRAKNEPQKVYTPTVPSSSRLPSSA